jgi:alkanesulfonate monooxygenase
VYLNMVAGGFKNDLEALNDPTPHDRRYDRLVEYTLVIQKLLAGGPVDFEGDFYRVRNLVLKPPLPPELMPGVFVSGSSDAGLAASKALGAVAVKYPEPVEECGTASPEHRGGFGVRVGVIARDTADEAWEVALARFPEDRRGQLTHQLAMKVSDSQWHKQLSDVTVGQTSERGIYWLGPFQHYKTFCPYLVGTYDSVGNYLGRYLEAGYRTFILDIPSDERELSHIHRAFRVASGMA